MRRYSASFLNALEYFALTFLRAARTWDLWSDLPAGATMIELPSVVISKGASGSNFRRSRSAGR